MLARLIANRLGRWLDAHNLYLLHRIHGASVGSIVTATAFMRGVHAETGRRFVVVTKYPEIFRHNPLVVQNVGMRQLGPIAKPIIKAVLRNADHSAIGAFGYRAPVGVADEELYRHPHRRRQISEMEFCAETLAQQWHVHLDYGTLAPEIHFSEEELQGYARKFALPAGYWLVKPVGIMAYTPNKEWLFDRYQRVVRHLPAVPWVQVGTTDEPLLKNTLDLRGGTNLRELFYLIRGARGVLAGEGLLNHVAAAFNVPSFVVFSGFSHVGLARYANTVPIVRTPQVDCAPCWLITACPVPGKPCTSDISVEQVIAAIRPHVG